MKGSRRRPSGIAGKDGSGGETGANPYALEDFERAGDVFHRVSRRAARPQHALVARASGRHDQIDVDSLGEQLLPQRDRSLLLAGEDRHNRRLGGPDAIPAGDETVAKPPDIRPEALAKLGT